MIFLENGEAVEVTLIIDFLTCCCLRNGTANPFPFISRQYVYIASIRFATAFRLLQYTTLRTDPSGMLRV